MYRLYMLAGMFLISMVFWTVQILLCRKAKHPVLRHILQICTGIAVILAFLFECDVFSRNHLIDVNETIACDIFYMLAAPMLIGSTAAWLFHGFRGKTVNILLTIPAGVIGLGLYEFLGTVVLNNLRRGIRFEMWGIMTVVFLLLAGVNAAARGIMSREKRT